MQPIDGMRFVRDVWCSADGRCLAVGATVHGEGAVVVLEPVGGDGAVRPVPGTRSLSGVTCADVTTCTAVGAGDTGAVVVEIDAAGIPGPTKTVSTATNLYDVACPTSVTCIATGNHSQPMDSYPYFTSTPVFVVVTGGEPEPAQRAPRGAERLIGIACPDTTTCLAAGNGRVAVLSSAGGTWSARLTSASDTRAYPTEAISCPSSSICHVTAVTHAGTRTRPAIMPVTSDGTLGPAQTLSRRSAALYAISCAGEGACVVAGQDTGTSQGVTIAVRDGRPTGSTLWPGANYLTGVHCNAGDACVVVGNTPTTAVFGWYDAQLA